jgi:hypothetical protein
MNVLHRVKAPDGWCMYESTIPHQGVVVENYYLKNVTIM